MTIELTAAQWSAVAATFSAISAFGSMLINRRNLLEAARPELVLSGWHRASSGSGENAHEILSFSSIKNVGRGPAIHVVINCFHLVADRPVAVMGTERLPILAPGGSENVTAHIALWWKNVPTGGNGARLLSFPITVLSWDSRGFRHETTYRLNAIELSPTVSIGDEIAPGVGFQTRTTTARAVWALRLQARAARIPLLGRIFRARTPKAFVA